MSDDELKKKTRVNIALTIISSLLAGTILFLSLTTLSSVSELNAGGVPAYHKEESGKHVYLAGQVLIPSIAIFLVTSRRPKLAKWSRLVSKIFFCLYLYMSILPVAFIAFFQEAMKYKFVGLIIISNFLYAFAWFQCCRRYEPLLKLEKESVPAEKK